MKGRSELPRVVGKTYPLEGTIEGRLVGDLNEW